MYSSDFSSKAKLETSWFEAYQYKKKNLHTTDADYVISLSNMKRGSASQKNLSFFSCIELILFMKRVESTESQAEHINFGSLRQFFSKVTIIKTAWVYFRSRHKIERVFVSEMAIIYLESNVVPSSSTKILFGFSFLAIASPPRFLYEKG